MKNPRPHNPTLEQAFTAWTEDFNGCERLTVADRASWLRSAALDGFTKGSALVAYAKNRRAMEVRE